MSCLNDGDNVENQRPELMAARSSIVRMGSSMQFDAFLDTDDWPALSGARSRFVQTFVTRVSGIRIQECHNNGIAVERLGFLFYVLVKYIG